ncbi:MAG: Biopolymer transport protein ExbD [Steroidobacteraceae bacterium]|nr:Biopolymer transport protein ExbD [Steroidobacteraceae bacterium]
MSMSVSGDGGGDDEPMVEMNTTPLIDVMLVLLIMFIITIPVMTHAVKLDMPRPTDAPPPPVPPEVVDIEIDFDGTIVWNGQVVPSLQVLESYFRQEAQKDPQPELHLRPDARARYDVVAKVLAAAQHNRMQKIGFVNTAEFRDD